MLEKEISEQLHSLIESPTTTHLPRHKWLEYITGCLDHATTIAQEPQLRAHEARAMLLQVIGNGTHFHNRFMLEAALEQARYAPMMLTNTPKDDAQERQWLLEKRWQAMKEAQQTHIPLPNDMLDMLNHNVQKAIHATCFANYRVGPMLQFFAEMLNIAYKLHDSGQPAHQLEEELGASSSIWRRYELKSERFKQEDGMIESFFDNGAAFPGPSNQIH